MKKVKVYSGSLPKKKTAKLKKRQKNIHGEAKVYSAASSGGCGCGKKRSK